jgi:pilus assembly protein CpaF
VSYSPEGVLVEARVRELISRLDIDPGVDSEQVHRLIEECVTDMFASGALLDPQETIREVHHHISGFGPLQVYFDDPEVEEIWINEPSRVFIAKNGKSHLTNIVLADNQVKDLVERMLRTSGRRLDLSQPFVDAVLRDGSRLHVVIPDITRNHWSINIRRFVVRPRSVYDLVGLGTLTHHAAQFLEAAVVSGLNVVVAGGTQAGKTTLLNSLLGCIGPQERIISCEEVFEIRINHPDWIAMQTRDASLEGTGEIPLRRLVREALRMRPTRLVVGEVRQGESLDLLIAMNSGMPSLSTVHANSAREAVTKLCTLPLLAGNNIPGEFVVPTVAGAVDLIVHTVTRADGTRRISEIAGVTGRVENGVVEMSTIFKDDCGVLVRKGGYPPHLERFAQAGFDLANLLNATSSSIREAA